MSLFNKKKICAKYFLPLPLFHRISVDECMHLNANHDHNCAIFINSMSPIVYQLFDSVYLLSHEKNFSIVNELESFDNLLLPNHTKPESPLVWNALQMCGKAICVLSEHKNEYYVFK